MTSILEYARLASLILALGAGGACNGLKETGRPGEAGRPAGWSGQTAKKDYALPDRAAFCGWILDLSRPAVRERLETEFIFAVNQPAQVALWQRRAREYFPTIEARLKAAGLPDDLKYLAVAESDLRPGALSPAGALGLWQFMPGTARRYGLAVNSQIDQRRLPDDLMEAAAIYLKALHDAFGDWPLALAAYNAGESRVVRAVAERGLKDYSQLDLPLETERYVYRMAAIKIILENPEAYGFTAAPPVQVYQPLISARRTVAVPDKSGWPDLAKAAGCDYKTLRLLNPHMLGAEFSGTYELRVPSDG
ncbi:MAG: lytic transglycosylase domain-containing protein [Candidatus Adiutrix sp.]|jgi:hypothetical protein|nr:lytic transglycosylase domain-containing protein [Candidatus Adiutrix sp.]